MKTRPKPYLHRDPGDVIRSGDWNELQVQAREEVHGHRHTGSIDGLKIPRDGIEPKAIDGTLIDPEANVVLNSLSLNSNLTLKGKSMLTEIDNLLVKHNLLMKTTTNDLGKLGEQNRVNLERVSQLENKLSVVEEHIKVINNEARVLATIHIEGGKIVSGTKGILFDASTGVVTFPNPKKRSFTPVISHYENEHYATSTHYIRQVISFNQFKVWRTTLDTGGRNNSPTSFTAIVVGF